MKTIHLVAALLAAPALLHAQSSHYVRPHVTKNGTYVEGHRQTNPDASRFNNWGTQGNYNPYTGQPGTIDPYKQPSPSSSWPQQAPRDALGAECGYNSRGQYVCR